ncbi:hypothetical protein [Cytobacillus gottheilii]|uniref:hypothetical protein n=1 Tax=Cytobacillus gottheilii TaxID=859144 RepID=UPI00082C89BB|nr:hypothetical protein [Cytobacillus gottheilii]
MFTTIFFTVVISIPVYGFLIWMYLEPEESMLVGKRWMYQEDPEVSDSAIRYTRFLSVTTMIGLPFLFISAILEIPVLRFVYVIFPVVILVGALKIFTDQD